MPRPCAMPSGCRASSAKPAPASFLLLFALLRWRR
ncbi:MYXO-CTERM sorting domain-containing protein [Comamonas sp.]